jgi:hypothetical protein
VATKQPAKGLDGRSRDQSGQIHHKRSDTKVETLRKAYGDGFAKGYRSDATLGTVLKKEGVETLNQLLKSSVVVRNASTGRFVVGGSDERKLVNKFASVSVKSAPAKPKHVTDSQIRELTKRMKVE